MSARPFPLGGSYLHPKIGGFRVVSIGIELDLANCKIDSELLSIKLLKGLETINYSHAR